jgi:hypothetical protein
MTTLDFSNNARFQAIEDRLVAIERDPAIIKTRLDNVPTSWMLIGPILPLYGLLIFGFAGLFYFSINNER